MTKLILLLLTIGGVHASRADEVDGAEVARLGLVALRQSFTGARRATGLGGWPAVVGYGLWFKLYQDFPPPPGLRTERGHQGDFVRHAERLLDDGVTLAELFRRAYPDVRGELTPRRMAQLALRPFGTGLDDVRARIEDPAEKATWVNVGDTCARGLAPRR